MFSVRVRPYGLLTGALYSQKIVQVCIFGDPSGCLFAKYMSRDRP